MAEAAQAFGQFRLQLPEGHGADHALGGGFRAVAVAGSRLGKGDLPFTELDPEFAGQAMVLHPQQGIHHRVEIILALQEGVFEAGAEALLSEAVEGLGAGQVHLQIVWRPAALLQPISFCGFIGQLVLLTEQLMQLGQPLSRQVDQGCDLLF